MRGHVELEGKCAGNLKKSLMEMVLGDMPEQGCDGEGWLARVDYLMGDTYLIAT